MILLVLETEPKYKFTIPIKSEDFQEDTENGMACDLTFTYTVKYPDEGPIIEIENPLNFLENNEKDLEEYLQSQVIQKSFFLDSFSINRFLGSRQFRNGDDFHIGIYSSGVA